MINGMKAAMNKNIEKETAVEDGGECYEIMIYMNVRGSICYETRTLCEIITALSITHSCQHGLKKCGKFSSLRWLSPDIYHINILRNPNEVDVNWSRSAKPKLAYF